MGREKGPGRPGDGGPVAAQGHPRQRREIRRLAAREPGAPRRRPPAPAPAGAGPPASAPGGDRSAGPRRAGRPRPWRSRRVVRGPARAIGPRGAPLRPSSASRPAGAGPAAASRSWPEWSARPAPWVPPAGCNTVRRGGAGACRPARCRRSGGSAPAAARSPRGRSPSGRDRSGRWPGIRPRAIPASSRPTTPRRPRDAAALRAPGRTGSAPRVEHPTSGQGDPARRGLRLDPLASTPPP